MTSESYGSWLADNVNDFFGRVHGWEAIIGVIVIIWLINALRGK